VVLTLSHPLDYLRWLLGEVDSLWSFTSHRGLQLPVEDMAEIGLRFTCGAIGSLHLDYDQRPPSHTLEIIGTHGTIRWDNADGTARVARVGQEGKAGEWQAYPPPLGFERNWLFLDEMRHFIEVARGITKPACSLQDGVMALRLALAARQQQLVKFSPENIPYPGLDGF
jgi:predicted dehydrogenase